MHHQEALAPLEEEVAPVASEADLLPEEVALEAEAAIEVAEEAASAAEAEIEVAEAEAHPEAEVLLEAEVESAPVPRSSSSPTRDSKACTSCVERTTPSSPRT